MKTYSSPKEALFAAGRIEKIGKGRISRENNAWLDEQVASGAFAVSTMTVKASTGPVPAPPTIERVKAADSGMLDVPDEVRRREDWEAFSEGKPVPLGILQVTQCCGSSLTYCRCATPQVRLLDGDRIGAVEFRVRKQPYPTKPW